MYKDIVKNSNIITSIFMIEAKKKNYTTTNRKYIALFNKLSSICI